MRHKHRFWMSAFLLVHGPYPVVVFAHGFSGFSGQSLPQMTHWASRGFVVVSADHPSVGLRTFLRDGIMGVSGGASRGGCDLAMASGGVCNGPELESS